MEPHHLALPVGFQIEHFRIEAVLGKGGFGITYLAVDLQLDKRVAIKELLPDTIATRIEGVTVVPHSAGMQENWEWARERFLEEARTLATFSHPAIVGVHRLLEANGTVYMVMDYVEGESYEARLQRIGTEPDQASLMAVIGPILSGLEEVHAHGLLHRDIKPENILIDKRGQPVLIDFGSARESVGKTMTMTSIVTHGYSPIEQYQTKGRMGPWTDIYALAAVMCRAMAGQKPPEAPDRIVEDEFVWLSYRDQPSFSATFSQSVDWALRVRPEERPQLVPDFVHQLTQSDGAATAGAAEWSELPPKPDDYREEKAPPNAAVPPNHFPAVVPKRNRWSVPVLTATVVVLLLVSAGAYMLASERSKRLAAEQAAAEQAQEMLRKEEQAAKEEQEKQEEAHRLALAQKQAEEKAAAELAQRQLEAKRKAKEEAKRQQGLALAQKQSEEKAAANLAQKGLETTRKAEEEATKQQAQANFFDSIKSDLTGRAVEGSPKYTALYFSAHWCPPCRMFTPKLVAWYNNFKPTHPDFELVFVSSDRDQAAMEKYIKGDKMPWPAVKFDKAQSETFRKFGSSGIPYLVLIDDEGNAVTAQPDNEWQSPQEVLFKIEAIASGS